MTTPQKKTLDELRSSLAWPREHRALGPSRAADDGRTLEMFIPFESESVDMGFREKVHPSAFTRSIRTGRASKHNDIRALWSHDSSKILARQANGTLEFEERDDGLLATASLSPDKYDYHREAVDLVRDRLVTGTSFGFEAVRDEWEYDDDGDATRTLLEVRLYEVSPVVFPAYQESGIEARTALAAAHANGIDLAALVRLLQEVRQGKVTTAHVLAVLAKVPDTKRDAVAPGADDYEFRIRQLATRERLVGRPAAA